MKCYFKGCTQRGVTKEHIPPKAFFPDNEKDQLLTVKSCQEHNNAKSKDDFYVLAHICMNASPSNRAREIFIEKVRPQLDFNNGELKKLIAKKLKNGNVEYDLDIKRFDSFFTALSFGIIYKSCGTSLPNNFEVKHVYPNFSSQQINDLEIQIKKFYMGKPMTFMEFGNPVTKNERFYTVEVFGVPEFASSLTIVHLFFGKFKVISMLTKKSVSTD